MSLFLSSCGFHPMYGDTAMQAERSPVQGNMQIAFIPGRFGQILHNALEDKFNPEGIKFAQPDYSLQVVLYRNLIPTVVRSDGTTLRNEVRLESNFTLIRLSDSKVIFQGSVRRSGSFNTSINENFATYEAEQDITERTLQEMAEDYVWRISGFFAHPHKEIVPKPDTGGTKSLF